MIMNFERKWQKTVRLVSQFLYFVFSRSLIGLFMLLAVFEKIRAISQNFRRGAEIRQQTLEKVFSISENLLPWLE